jgi:hypothetical protein
MTSNSQTTNVQTDNDNADNSYAKSTYPTITIIDSSGGRQGLVLDEKPMNYCCICIPEHVGVAAILSLYSLYGILSCIASFAGLTIYNDSIDESALIISGILYCIISVTSFFGILALRQDNVIAMRRISIAIWVITAFLFIYNTVDYILEIVARNESINRCQTELTGEEISIDCVQVINMFLIKEAFRVLFIEFFSIYFSYIIYRYSHRTMGSRKNIVPYVEGQITPTYVVYSNSPPTAHDWVPPPTYTVRPNDPIPSDTDIKDASSFV